MIVFAHTKFGLVRIQVSEVKVGGGGGQNPRSERFFKIPVRVGLSDSLTLFSVILPFVCV